MRTPRLPIVERTEAPADLNRLFRFAERWNLVSARVLSHFNWPLSVSYVRGRKTEIKYSTHIQSFIHHGLMYFDNCRSASWNSASKRLRTCGYQGNRNFKDQIPSKQTLQNLLHRNSAKQQTEVLHNSETSKQAHYTKRRRTPKKGCRIARVKCSVNT